MRKQKLRDNGKCKEKLHFYPLCSVSRERLICYAIWNVSQFLQVSFSSPASLRL